MKSIIVDLDGTLCNANHRKHFVEGKSKSWDKFYDGISEDTPNNWCYELVRSMDNTDVHIIYVSGRPEDYRDKTVEWLIRHELNIGPLFMRKSGDFRKDSIIKTEIYREHIEPKYKVLFCVDDRQQVVDAWRSLGLTCLQCDVGDF